MQSIILTPGITSELSESRSENHFPGFVNRHKNKSGKSQSSSDDIVSYTATDLSQENGILQSNTMKTSLNDPLNERSDQLDNGCEISNFDPLFFEPSVALDHKDPLKNLKSLSLGQNSIGTNRIKLITEPFALTASKLHLSYHTGANHQLRGGGDSENNASDDNYSTLINKFNRYKEKRLNDSSLDTGLQLLIEPYAKSHLLQDSLCSNDTESSELTLNLRKRFLNPFGTSKVLLLTGEAGVGKSFFCKKLQRELLSAWENSTKQELDEIGERLWFPVYGELPSLKNPNTEAISETLERELSLTKEEILTLQTADPSDFRLPCLLFIFDGYDTVQDLQAFENDKDFVSNNFSLLNKIEGKSWQNTKFIITCREENLQRVSRRDLLFAPINHESIGPAIIPESFLQFTLEPFTSEQITCYLRRYCFSQQKVTAVSDLLVFQETPWNSTKRLDKMIDDYNLREIARMPFLLSIIADVLSDGESRDDTETHLTTRPVAVSRRALVDHFVNQLIKAVAQSNGKEDQESKHSQGKEDKTELNDLIQEIKQQAQNLALAIFNSPINSEAAEEEKNDFSPILEAALATKSDETNYGTLRFRFPLLLEFFVAKSIEDEINKLTALPQNEIIKGLHESLINKRLLTTRAEDSKIILFLQDALKDKSLSPEQLLNIIQLSRREELDVLSEPPQMEKSQIHFNSSITVAAANAITILNASGYDFSNEDFSNICIPGANLSHGVFEGTNFANANLQGVDFTGAWLKDVNLANTNLEEIELGELPHLRLEAGKKITGIAYSADGKYIAIESFKETFIFEINHSPWLQFQEIAIISGHFSGIIDCPFSIDGKKIVTILGDKIKKERFEEEPDDSDDEDYRSQKRNPLETKKERYVTFCIWDFASRSRVKELKIDIGNDHIIDFSLDCQEIVLFDGKMLRKYNFEEERWLGFPAAFEKIKNCNFSVDSGKTFIAGFSNRGAFLYNFATGERLRKQRQACRFGNISYDGKQIAARLGYSKSAHVSDSVRGHIIKAYDQFDSQDFLTCKITLGEKLSIISLREKGELRIYDPTDISNKVSISCSGGSSSQNYCLSPDGKHIAFLQNKNTIMFRGLFASTALHYQARGMNKKGLNLQSAKIEGSNGLSEGKIGIFKQFGVYNEFDIEWIRHHISCSSENAENIKEITLSAQKLSVTSALNIGRDCRWRNLRILDLSRNSVGDEVGETIANNRTWANLEELRLMYAEIGNKTAMAIANNSTWVKLKELRLASNRVSDVGAIAIGKSKFWEQLKILDLNNNEIEDEGASCLGENTLWTELRTLDLGSNKIGNAGAKEIATNKTWLNLEKFCLYSNKVTEKDIIFLLSRNDVWKKLKIIMLQGNPITLQESEMLHAIEITASNDLEIVNLPSAKFDRRFLGCLKNSSTTNVTEVSLSESGCSDLAAIIVGSNLTWTNLTKLDLSNNEISDEAGTKIARNTTWINLEEINLSTNLLGTQSGTEIGNNVTWSKLKTLNLNKNSIRTAGARAIANNTTWVHLQFLGLSGNSIESEGAIELSKNTTWTELQTLELVENLIQNAGLAALSKNNTWKNLHKLDLQKNEIDANGAAELSKNASWVNLQSLNLNGNKIQAEGAAMLAKNTTWIHLQSLNLSGNSIGSLGLTKLSQNTSWSNLQVLELQSNSIDSQGVEELCKNTSWKNLRTLDLKSNFIGNEGAEMLSKNTTWTHLEALMLGNNIILEKGAEELAKNTLWIGLHTLDLQLNQIGDAGLEELSKNTTWTNLQILNLKSNTVGVKGVKALSSNLAWVNLRDLNLGSNKLGFEGTTELSKNDTWTKLTSLNLHNNSLDKKAAAELSRNESWTNLEALNLSWNRLGGKGVEALSRNSSWKNLKSLMLHANSISPRGAAGLARNMIWTNLQEISLGLNNIGNEGALELSKNTSWTNLKELSLQSNSICEDGARELGKNTSWINLQMLLLRSSQISNETAEKLTNNSYWPNLKKLEHGRAMIVNLF
mgnify:FL=1